MKPVQNHFMEAPNGSRQRRAMPMRPVRSYSHLTHPGYHIWGGTMVRDPRGTCHLFYSRWPRAKGFNAWVSHSEIAHAVADEPLGPYTHVDTALPARGDGWWDGHCTHNPTILRHDGRYYLYYMGNTGDEVLFPDQRSLNFVHRNQQRIGVAVADHLSGPWIRFDMPLVDISPDPTAPDSLAVSNPAVTQRPEGGFLMIYKAVGTEGALPFGGPVVHRVAVSQDPAGPFDKLPGLVFTHAETSFPAEDPFVWTQEGMYFAILKDMDGHFSGGGRSLVLFESQNGLDWQLADPCLVSDRNVLCADGRTQKYDYLERPQLYLEGGAPRVLFCAARKGDRACNIHIPIA